MWSWCAPGGRAWPGTCSLRRNTPGFNNRGETGGAFYTLWTLKEARVKCTGQGLRQLPRTIAVPLLAPGEEGTLDGLVFRAYAGESWRAAACCVPPEEPPDNLLAIS